MNSNVTPTLTADLIPPGLSGKSLNKLLKRSAWTKLRNHVIRSARFQCEICGAGPEQLQAHEVWDYIDASFVHGLEANEIEAAIAEYKLVEQKKFADDFAALNRIALGKAHICRNEIHGLGCKMPASAKVMICNDFDPEREIFPKVAILKRIEALCRRCHICKHYRCDAENPTQLRSGGFDTMLHWCSINNKSPKNFISHYRNERLKVKRILVVKVDYRGYDQHSNFKI
jgi:hypothetical protein